MKPHSPSSTDNLTDEFKEVLQAHVDHDPHGEHKGQLIDEVVRTRAERSNAILDQLQAARREHDAPYENMLRDGDGKPVDGQMRTESGEWVKIEEVLAAKKAKEPIVT